MARAYYLKENNCEVQGLGIMFFCLCVYGYVFSNGFSEYIGINNGYSLIFASFLYITGRVINEKEAVIKKGWISLVVRSDILHLLL